MTASKPVDLRASRSPLASFTWRCGMKRLMFILALAMSLTFDSAIAIPRISPQQDFNCALHVYGTRVDPELDRQVEKEVNRIKTLAEAIFRQEFNVIWGYGIAYPTT